MYAVSPFYIHISRMRNFQSYYNYTARPNFNFRHLSREAKQSYKHYEKALCNTKKLKARKCFLQSCIEEQVVPKSLKIHLECDFSPFHIVKREMLKDRVQALDLKISHEYRVLRRRHRDLRFFANPNLVSQMENKAHSYAEYQERLTSSRLQQKIQRLCNESIWNHLTMPENVVNMSSRHLSHLESNVLGLGLSFSLPPSKRDIVSTAASFDRFLFQNRQHIEKPDLFRGIVSPLLLSIKNESPLLPKRMQQALTDLDRCMDIKVMPADKGGKVVIMDRAEYDAKIFDLLSDDNTYVEVASNPLKEQNKFIRSISCLYRRNRITR